MQGMESIEGLVYLIAFRKKILQETKYHIYFHTLHQKPLVQNSMENLRISVNFIAPLSQLKVQSQLALPLRRCQS